MKNKNLKEHAIDIRGKKYVLVSDRIIFFNEAYPKGSIRTKIISGLNDEMVVVQAVVLPDSANPAQQFTAYSQAKWNDGYINKTSALENCETSAVGRALAFMGIGVLDSIASVDEINKAQTHSGYKLSVNPVMSRGIVRKTIWEINTMKTTLTAVSVKESDKNGKLYFDSYSKKNQARVAIQVNEENLKGVWLSYFAPLGDWTTTWTAGESVDIEWSKKGDYFNFKPLKASPATIEKLQEGAARVKTWTPPQDHPFGGDKPVIDLDREEGNPTRISAQYELLKELNRKVDAILNLISPPEL